MRGRMGGVRGNAWSARCLPVHASRPAMLDIGKDTATLRSFQAVGVGQEVSVRRMHYPSQPCCGGLATMAARSRSHLGGYLETRLAGLARATSAPRVDRCVPCTRDRFGP